ncbi:MAG TPA: hypothetical protein VM686_00515, partial [Polyangiaceae bacterium]|nr:hypothetical protein [Polyangiaceae bacterium]
MAAPSVRERPPQEVLAPRVLLALLQRASALEPLAGQKPERAWAADASTALPVGQAGRAAPRAW